MAQVTGAQYSKRLIESQKPLRALQIHLIYITFDRRVKYRQGSAKTCLHLCVAYSFDGAQSNLEQRQGSYQALTMERCLTQPRKEKPRFAQLSSALLDKVLLTLKHPPTQHPR